VALLATLGAVSLVLIAFGIGAWHRSRHSSKSFHFFSSMGLSSATAKPSRTIRVHKNARTTT
jgi:hypothetical protein